MRANNLGYQYLAVGGYKDSNEHRVVGLKQTEDLKNSPIQIWEVSSGECPKSRLCIGICHDFGVIFDLKWMPYGGCTSNRMGLLAVTFGDGKIRVIIVPTPTWLHSHMALPESTGQADDDNRPTVWLRLISPAVELESEKGLLWRVEWGGHEILAVGSTKGTDAFKYCLCYVS